ncbi:MAG: hypothetical protein R2771_04160 [Saprospiraceae bacterium]
MLKVIEIGKYLIKFLIPTPSFILSIPIFMRIIIITKMLIGIKEMTHDISYYYYNEPVKRNFICSDFSIIVKKAEREYTVAVADLLSLDYIDGADVVLYDLQGDIIAESETDCSGIA